MKTKNKLTINQLAVGNLKQRKKQYAIMIIGIILAMTFSGSVIFFMFSASETYRQRALRETGYQDAIVYVENFTEKDYKTAITDGAITDYGIAHTIGYAYTQEDAQRLGASVAWLDDKAKEISNQIILEGSYPSKENEIAIENRVLYKLGYKDAKLGDTIKLKMKVQDSSEGNNYLNTVDKEYKLVGIVSDKKEYIQTMYSEYDEYDTLIPAVFVAKNTDVELGGKEKITAYVIRNDDYTCYDEDIDDYVHNFQQYFYEHRSPQDCDMDINDVTVVNRLQLTSFGSIAGSTEYLVLIIAILAIASCVAIINSFNTNLKERKKQIGMLRAVGTTKKQIINIFGREAFIISLIATPVSVLISYVLVRIMIGIMSDEAVMSNSIWSLAVAAVVDIGVVMLSALIPLLAATKITPMQAIRNIDNTRKVKTKNIKSKMEFNVPNHIASRNAKFYKGGKTAVSIILSATILFSSIGFSYLAYEKENVKTIDSDYRLSLSNTGGGSYYNDTNSLIGLSETDRQDIAAMPYISNVSGEKGLACAIDSENSKYMRVLNYDNYLELDLEKYDKKTSYEMAKDQVLGGRQSEYFEADMKKMKIKKDMLSAKMYSYDNDLLSKIESKVYAGKIDYDKLASGEEIILVAPKTATFYMRIGSDSSYSTCVRGEGYTGANSIGMKEIVSAECPYKVGDTLDITIAVMDLEIHEDEEGETEEPVVKELIKKSVKIGAMISPDDVDSLGDSAFTEFRIMTNHKGMNSFYPNLKYTSLRMDSDIEIDDEIDEQIMDDLTHYKDKYSGWLSSNYEYVQNQESSTRSMFITLFAMIVICFVICASIINNIITARIRENKRVIGTLRAVGASQSDLIKSYIYQLLSMFGVGVAVGYIGYLLFYFVLKALSLKMEFNFEFLFNPWYSVIMTVILFVMCTLNIWSKIRKETKNSIIENIREL